MASTNLTDAEVALQLFAGYTDSDTAIFEEFVNRDAKPQTGFLVDFLGCRIRTTSLWKEARALDGQVIGIPVPGDFHAEAIEWIGLLKAVRSASDQYVAMEVGAGFGPWVIAGAVAARRRGIKHIRLCAVEGDSKHFQFLRQHFIDNGFESDQHALYRAAVGTSAGVARWPVIEDAATSEAWGCRPLESAGDYMGREFQKTESVDVIPMRDLVIKESCWDLVHLDVQGHEVDICRSCIDELSARARWLIAATHSRKLDGDLLELMSGAGWLLEHEKPAKFTFMPDATTLEAMTTLDGTQVWRNPRLLHAGDQLCSFSQEIISPLRELQGKACETYWVSLTTKNTGTQPWFGGPHRGSVNGGYRWFDNQGNLLPIEGPRASLETPVIRPGETSRLNLQVVMPPNPGSYALWISMVQEGVSWFFERGAAALILQVSVE